MNRTRMKALLLEATKEMHRQGRRLLEIPPGHMWTKKEENGGNFTWVSEAEREAEWRIHEWLRQTVSDPFLFVGEETNPAAELDPGKLNYILDPLDGSGPHRGTYGWAYFSCTLACLEGLSPLFGITYFPLVDVWYVAARFDGDLTRVALTRGPAGMPIGIERGTRSEDVSGNSHEKGSYMWVGSDAHRRFDLSKFKGKIRALGATACHLCRLAEGGGADPAGVLLSRWRLYDACASLMVTEAEGFEVFDLEKRQLTSLGNLTAKPRAEVDHRALLICRPEIRAHILQQIKLKEKVASS